MVDGRSVAHKLFIRDVVGADFRKGDGFNPNYLNIEGKEVSRVNIIGVLTQKVDAGSYLTMVIEDGTGRISSRVFEKNTLADEIDVGDVVLIIGRPREFLEEKYILIEIIKRIAPLWARFRSIELVDTKGNKGFETEIFNGDSPRDRVLKLIRELDKGEGVGVDEIPKVEDGNVDDILKVLLRKGDIFEVKPGKVKILE